MMVSHYTSDDRKAATRPSAGATLGALAALCVVLLLVTVSIAAPAIWPSARCLRASTMQDETHPVADAGANRTVYVDMNVTFNGSASTDDVGVVNYTWTFDDGSAVTLYGETAVYVFSSAGTYIVTLTVLDGDNNSDTDDVTLTVIIDTIPPEADAGLGYSILIGTLVTLDATRSEDNAGIVSYSWNISKDGEVRDILEGPLRPYYFNETGNYTITLAVNKTMPGRVRS